MKPQTSTDLAREGSIFLCDQYSRARARGATPTLNPLRSLGPDGHEGGGKEGDQLLFSAFLREDLPSAKTSVCASVRVRPALMTRARARTRSPAAGATRLILNSVVSTPTPGPMRLSAA